MVYCNTIKNIIMYFKKCIIIIFDNHKQEYLHIFMVNAI